MARIYIVLLGLILLTTSSSASLAGGQHIACHFAGSSCNSCDRSGDKAIERTLSFYLDDTKKQLVPDGGAVKSARTNLYWDTLVKADITINSVPESGPSQIAIDRIAGTAVLTTMLVPAGIDIENGDCHEVAAPPAQ
jgi:hypothetical protein